MGVTDMLKRGHFMKKVALVDIGSNTVRLCLYKVNKGKKYQLLLNIKESVRLRNHVKDHVLTDDGISALINVLSTYKKIIKKKDAHLVKYFATQTIRMVDNQKDILNRVYETLDIKIDMLSEEQESLLGFQGMNHYLKHEEEGVYLDLGGGSAEIVHFEHNKPVQYALFDFGSVVLRQMISSAIPTDAESYQIREYVRSKLMTLPWLTGIQLPLIVVGGSSRNLVRLDRFFSSREEDTHGYILGFRELNRTRKILQLLTVEEIKKINGFTPSRADLIVPSLIVFETIFEFIHATYYVCSVTGLREGVLLQMIGEYDEPSLHR